MIQTNRNDDVLVNVERRTDPLRKYIRDIVVGVGPVVDLRAESPLPLLRLHHIVGVWRMKNEPLELQFADATEFRPCFESRISIFTVRIRSFDESQFGVKIGPNFNPELGFIETADSDREYADATFKTRPKFGGIRELQFEGFIFHAPDTHDVVQTQEWQGTFRAEFNNGAYTDDDIADVFTQRISSPLNIYKNIVIPIGVYHFARHQLTYGSRLDRRFTYNFFERRTDPL